MAAEMAERIGQRMQARRAELGLTQAEVATRIEGKTTSDQVSRWERGRHQPQNLAPIAKALEVDASYFYAPEPNKTVTPDLLDGALAGDGSIQEQLAEMGKAIDKQADALVTQAGVLEELRDAVQDLRELIATQRAAARQMDEATKALEAATGRTRQPAGTSPRSGNTQKSPAAAPRPQTRP
jgi:transcriptional regulator with XRE-family HTH domain